MENKKNILDELNKREKPSVPNGFFENFSDELMAKIAEQESGLGDLKKTAKPEVPAGFFEGFTPDIPKSGGAPTRSTRVYILRAAGFASAIAACLLVMFYLMPNDGNESDLSYTSDTTISEDNVSDEELLAYVDGDDILDFIVNNEDIEIDDETTTQEDEDVFYYLEEDIEDLYLEGL